MIYYQIFLIYSALSLILVERLFRTVDTRLVTSLIVNLSLAFLAFLSD